MKTNHIREPIIMNEDDYYGGRLIDTTNNQHFQQYKDIYKGRKAIIFATGNTLNDFDSNTIESYSEMIKVGVNHIYKNKGITDQLDYYFFGDFIDDLPEQQTEVRKMSDRIKKVITLDNYTEEYGFTNLMAVDVTYSIHLVKDIEKYKVMGHSIVFPALQFLLYTGVTDVYLVGCDCTKTTSVLLEGSSGHFYDECSERVKDEFMVWLWHFMKENIAREYPEANIRVVNPVALRGVFE